MAAKPLFTAEFVAFSPFDRSALRALIQRIDKPFKRILEIGSWTGNGSTRTIVEALRDREGIVYCVDHWRGNDNVLRHQDLAAQFDMFNTFRVTVESYGGAEVVKPLVMSSKEAADIMRDHALDLVFIDGTHSYEQTKQDIELWLPKVMKRGILCGHDCEARETHFDKTYLWKNRHCDTIKGTDVFPVIHPGVILAVGEKFGPLTHLWAEDLVKLDDGTCGRSTIWDFRVN